MSRTEEPNMTADTYEHGIDDPTSTSDAAPRESIEVRRLLFFAE
jgi:hypothetical protein